MIYVLCQSLQCCKHYNTAVTEAEHKSEFKANKDTSYFILKICGVYGENRKRPHYITEPPFNSYLFVHIVWVEQWRYIDNDIPNSTKPYLSKFSHQDFILAMLINPLNAKIFIGIINMHLKSISFLHTDMTQVVEIIPYIRQVLTHSK